VLTRSTSGAGRTPLIISFLLVAIAIYIRLSLAEPPVFQEIKAKGQTAPNPLARGLPAPEHPVRGDRQYRRAGAGLCLVDRQETRCAAMQLRRWHSAPDRDADAESPRLVGG